MVLHRRRMQLKDNHDRRRAGYCVRLVSGYDLYEAVGEHGMTYSLEHYSFCYILTNFELFPAQYVALIPTRMRRKLLLHLPAADVCKLEGTAALEGIDVNELWNELVETRLTCPSPQRARARGYKQFYCEEMFRGSMCTSLLCKMWCPCGNNHPDQVLPARYFPTVEGLKELLRLAWACFKPLTRLRLSTYDITTFHMRLAVCLKELYLKVDSHQMYRPIGRLLSSSRRLVSLHFDCCRWYGRTLCISHVITDVDIKSLPSSLREVQIHNVLPGPEWWGLLDFISFLANLQVAMSGVREETSTPSLAEFMTKYPHPLYTNGSYLYTADNKSILLDNVTLPESILKDYNFKRIDRKRKR